MSLLIPTRYTEIFRFFSFDILLITGQNLIKRQKRVKREIYNRSDKYNWLF